MALLVLAGCKKDDNYVFEQTANERMEAEVARYQTALETSQYGWNAQLVTAAGGIYNFHFSFNNANRVKTFGDIDTATSSVETESSYRLKALRVPSLLFDTYTYLHILADPDGSVNGGDSGAGLYSDFEFTLDTLAGDSIKLTGRQQGSKLTFKKSTQADYQAWTNGSWRSAVLFQSTSSYILQYFKRLTIGGVQYEVRINTVTRTVTFIWVDGTTPRAFTTSYYFNSNGVELTNPLVNGGTTIRFLTNLTWNSALASFNLNVNGNTPALLSGAIAPLVNDANAPRRWWNAALGDPYWVSETGFYSNGVRDAFGITKLPGYLFLTFFSQFGTDSGVTYDLSGFILNGASGAGIYYGPAFRPPTFANGRIYFSFYGVLGDANLPADDTPFVNTVVQFLDTQGYYLVQTGASTYDMVCARDAKTWINWIQ